MRAMHTLAGLRHSVLTGVGRRSTAAALQLRAAPLAAAAAPPAARPYSTLPIIEEYVRRTYPFPTILESNIPPDYSNWLYYHQQHPHDLPTYKSKLTVDIRDLGLDPTSRMVLREMVGGRFDSRTHHVSFVSKNLPSAAANENRVFQMLDACLLECRRIGKEMNEQGFYAKTNGAVHNRLLKPPPPLKTNKGKGKKKAATTAASSESAAAGGSDAAAPAAAAGEESDVPKKVNYTKGQRHYRALGMQSPYTDKVLTPVDIKPRTVAKAAAPAPEQPAQQQQQQQQQGASA